ncbi:hypothetical protein KFK09_011703 [Dendrobium nobile]|uniref:CCT domain-containing protein n=1 Tax=Dendrobium nobile TaxID=94219 RepID=A0A8T3BGK4_DENNO|nr:hypothetical protein KFK09_011703 [Dendrobium nobile]
MLRRGSRHPLLNLPQTLLFNQSPTVNFSSPTTPDDPFPVLLPSFPISGDPSLLLQSLPSPAKSPVQTKLTNSQYTIIHSPTDFQYQDAGSPDFDAESILDEEVEEGIDSIMGNLSMSKESTGDCLNSNSNSIINPCLASLMGFGLKGVFGFGFGISSNIRGALRQSNDGEWWRSPKVAVKDIIPMGKTAAMADKNKKKKKKKVEAIDKKVSTAVSPPEDGILKAKLGLKLNYDAVLKEWSGGSPFSGEAGSPDSAAELIVSLTDNELLLEMRDGAMREASVQRYKEKRRNRLFSKKIRYEVRKTNANQRPRMKGRFVRGPSVLQEAITEGR